MMFEMSDAEAEKASAWIKKHNEERHKGRTPYAGAIGGAHSYEFTPTGLGVVCIVRCMCGAKENITDFDQW